MFGERWAEEGNNAPNVLGQSATQADLGNGRECVPFTKQFLQVFFGLTEQTLLP